MEGEIKCRLGARHVKELPGPNGSSGLVGVVPGQALQQNRFTTTRGVMQILGFDLLTGILKQGRRRGQIRLANGQENQAVALGGPLPALNVNSPFFGTQAGKTVGDGCEFQEYTNLLG